MTGVVSSVSECANATYIADDQHRFETIAIIAEACGAYFASVVDQVATEQASFAVGECAHRLLVRNTHLNGPSMQALSMWTAVE